MRLTTVLLAIGTALLLTACNGPKAMSKRAGELHAAGFSEQAAHLYYMALRKRPTYTDAMVGMRQTGQGVVDGLIGEFQQAAMDGRRADAIQLYDRMVDYQEKIARVQVDLIIPASVVADHDDLLDGHLIELSEQGHRQLDEQDYAGAEATFREILRLDAQYGDAAALLTVARAEPRYQAGRTALESGLFRDAHAKLAEVVGLDANYKDAADLRDEALELGLFNVAVTDFQASDRDMDVALELRSGIQNGLLQANDPFIGVVDRTLREDIIAEQHLSLSGLSDETVAVGELAGARAMLTGSVLSYSAETSNLQTTSRSGFRKYFKQVKDEEGNLKKVAAFAPASYKLYTQRRQVELKFELKLISTETGEVLLSEVERVHAQDAVEYAVSQVQAGSLYPARANGEVNRSGKSRMNALLGARRDLATLSALRAQVIAEATTRGRRDIEQFLERHIK